MIFWFSVVAMAISMAKSEINLLHNGDFEETCTFFNDWFCMGPPCTLTLSTLARGGNYSVKVSGRTANWNGLAQMVSVTAGERYILTAYIQLLNTTNDAKYQTVELMEMCIVAGKRENRTVGMTPFVTKGEWVEVGGVHKIAADSEDCRYYVQTDAPADYVVDDVRLIHIPTTDYEVWESNTDTRIDELRKENLSIRLDVKGSFEEDVVIGLEQAKMEFIMGSAVDAYYINYDTKEEDYIMLFNNNFDWGVLMERLSLKEIKTYEQISRLVMTPDFFLDADRGVWERSRNDNYEKRLLSLMIRTRIKMRCHSVVTSVEGDIKGFKDITGPALDVMVEEHAVYLLNLTKGLCDQWDVNYGHLHGDYFERNTGNPSFTEDLFRAVNSIDDKPRLFLSDFEVISGPEATVAMKNTALKYKAANVQIGGIGVQGHMEDIDYQLIKERLDLLGMAGVPIIITDFQVDEANETVRAKKFKKLMRLFFSHPDVEGVVLSGFLTPGGGMFDIDTDLFYTVFDEQSQDEYIQANAVGTEYQYLFRSAWRTNEVQALNGHNDVYSTRAFRGQYHLKVKYGGDLLATYNFTLAGAGRHITISIDENPTQIGISAT